jgi:deoxyribodipyrimidine photo-lyase
LSSFAKSLNSICKKIFGDVSWNDNIAVIGGRKNGLELLDKSAKEQKHYDTERDTFVYETSKLSAHLKFGTISVREVYWKWHDTFGKKSGILRELFWREFFARALFHFPSVLSNSYQPKFKHIKWHNSEQDFNKWKEGKTGYPIVDAGMRQMNATGYMHNRARMIVASFLVKTLLIDWTKGEQYFATKLVDYDVASNNGGWQGISGTGIDMKPYFRDMNPWIQAKKFDKETKYIKQWVEELRDISAKDILNWNEKWQEHKEVYYEPMVDYNEQKKKMLQMYREAI